MLKREFLLAVAVGKMGAIPQTNIRTHVALPFF